MPNRKYNKSIIEKKRKHFSFQIEFSQIQTQKKTNMMKNLKFYSIAILALLFATTELTFAQMQAPAASPAATVSQNVGFTKISMEYSSPALKGRKVFGDIEKYGVTWRAGANAATTIEFSTGVSIGGKNIRPGKYTLFITPQSSGEWTVRLNGKGNSVFTYMKDGKID